MAKRLSRLPEPWKCPCSECTFKRAAHEYRYVHDSGDEDDYREPPPQPRTVIDDLLDENPEMCVPEHFFWMAAYADSMRSCCRACALEANGEDGS